MKPQHTYTEDDKWLSTILNSVSDAVIATDRNGWITFMNPAAEILTGWEMEEVSGKRVTDILNICVRDRGGLRKDAFLIEALQKGSVTTGGLSSTSGGDHDPHLIAKSGQEIPIDYNISPIKDGMENLTGIVITFHDITRYKTMEGQLNRSMSELRHQTRLMKTVFDSMYDGIVELGLSGEILFANPSMEQIFGSELPDTLPNQWPEMYGIFYPDKETRVPMDQILTHISHGEEIRDQAFFIRNKEQPEGIHIRASAIPLFDENQEVIACLCIVRDILRADPETTHPFDEIVGKSRNMQQMFTLMQRAAEGDITCAYFR